MRLPDPAPAPRTGVATPPKPLPARDRLGSEKEPAGRQPGTMEHRGDGWLVLHPGSSPARQRVARHLLDGFVRDSDATLLEDGETGALFLSAAVAVLDDAARLLLPLFGHDALGRTTAVLPGARNPAIAASTMPVTAPPSPSTTPLPARWPVVGLTPNGLPRLAGLQLGTGASPGLPPFQQQSAVLRLAEALRDEEALAALLGGDPLVPLHLDAPTAELAALLRVPTLPVLPVLPLEAMLHAVPEGVFALRGIGAETLGLDLLHDLPGAVLHLCWSPALAALPTRMIASLGPGRMVLDAVNDEWALAWGLHAGIGRFTGAQPSRLLAATRRRGCPYRDGCDVAQCQRRAEATTPAGRAGCAAPSRLLGGEAAA